MAGLRAGNLLVVLLVACLALGLALPPSESRSSPATDSRDVDANELKRLKSRSSPKCVTMASGYMVTSTLAVGLTNRHDPSPKPINHKPFALNAKNEIAFYNVTKPKIYAEFQACTPNYFGSPNDGKSIVYSFGVQYWGRVYVPSHKACIGIENAFLGPKNENFLFVPRLMPCLNTASGAMKTKASIPQNFAYRKTSDGRKQIFWAGSSTYKPPTYQGLCESGLLGYYQELPNGYPIVGPLNRIQYVCNADSENAVAAAELL